MRCRLPPKKAERQNNHKPRLFLQDTHRNEVSERLDHVGDCRAAEKTLEGRTRRLKLLDEQHPCPEVVALGRLRGDFHLLLRQLHGGGGGGAWSWLTGEELELPVTNQV